MEQLKPGFVWTLREVNPDGSRTVLETIRNLMPVEALNHMLGVTFKEATQYGDFYVGLYSGSYTPIPGDTMATFPTTATELTAYTSATRPALTLGAVADGNVNNLDDITEFVGTTDGVTAVGGFISTAPAKGGTTGPLLSAVRFSTARTLNNGGRLEVGVVFQFISV